MHTSCLIYKDNYFQRLWTKKQNRVLTFSVYKQCRCQSLKLKTENILEQIHYWLFNNMRTLKFKVWPTNAFFAAVNQMLGRSSQLTTTAEHCFIAWTVHNDLITTRSAIVGRWEDLLNIWLTVTKNAFVSWALNFRVCMLLKGAIIGHPSWITCHVHSYLHSFKNWRHWSSKKPHKNVCQGFKESMSLYSVYFLLDPLTRCAGYFLEFTAIFATTSWGRSTWHFSASLTR